MNEHVVLWMPSTDELYEADFSAWSLRQAELIRDRRFDLIDADNIAEEIESLARKELRSIEKRLRTLVEHLLKLKFFSLSDEPQRGWRVTLTKSRDNLESDFRDNPSLFAQREAIYLDAWRSGARIAAVAIDDDPKGVAAIREVSRTPVFSIDAALDPNFFPTRD